MLTYMPGVSNDLDQMQRDLETIANLTKGTEETVDYMKDSTAAAQKSSGPGNTFSLIYLVQFVLMLVYP